MADKIKLLIGDTTVDTFLSYRIDADLFVAGDAFSLELSRSSSNFDEGTRCTLHVNDRPELTGIVDRIEDGNDKRRGTIIRLEGRDLMGLIVDSFVEEYVTLDKITLKGLAEQLLKNVPFINRSAIQYQDGIAGAAAKNTSSESSLLGSAQAKAQIEPGQTVFEVLKDHAMSRGAMFFSLPDGTFVFGRPKAKGKPAYQLIRRFDGKGNNVIEGRRVRDISQRYSKVTVLGQQQGQDTFGADQINIGSTVTDPGVPFYKPYVTRNNNDEQSPPMQARLLVERQRAKGFQLIYRVARHSQSSLNWTVNELCEVEDEVLGVQGTYLIYGRTFELNKDDGPTTELRLTYPGVIQ